MMSSQILLIALSNSLHLVATIVWIGWSVLLALVVAPRALDAHRADGSWVATLSRRAPPLAYGALALLAGTGMLQMGANEQYEGMFVIGNPWSIFLLVKHIFIIVSVALIIILGQVVSPQLRLAVRREALGQAHNGTQLASRFRLLAWLNFILGVGVLIMTGFMTAIP